MANLLRGQVPFTALGVDRYLCYGTREIAEAQTALGFRRPDPQQPDTLEESVILTEAGPVAQSVVVDASMRQARMIAAYQAVLMSPDPDAALIFFRVGLRPWERELNAKISEDAFHAIVRAVGLGRINQLHYLTLQHSCYLQGEEDDSGGKAQGAASASST